MDVLIAYVDTGSPARYLRFLEAGLAQQVLADGQVKVAAVLCDVRNPAQKIRAALSDPLPAIVALCVDEFNLRPSLQAAQQVKEAHPGVKICVFGVASILSPDKLINSGVVDYLIIGEAEIALLELSIQVRSAGDVQVVKNLWWRQEGQVQRNPLRPLQENLDLLPFPNRDLFRQEAVALPPGEQSLYVLASRGCPYECLFCYTPVIKKAYEGKGVFYRYRTGQNVAGEVLAEMRRGNYRSVVFVDEQFPTERTFLKLLAAKLSSGDVIPFQCTLAVERCDKDTLSLLYEAGCRRIALGVETGNEGFRKRLTTRNLNNEKLAALVASAREIGIGVVTTNMIGLPLESEPLIQETYKFNQMLNPDEVRTSVYHPIESTQLYAYAREKQYLPESNSAGDADFTNLSLKLPDLPPEKVRAYIYRMHFLDVMQKLQRLPKGVGYFDFLAEFPRAKFKLKHSASVDVGKATIDALPVAYFAIEAGSEIRYSMTLRAKSRFHFALAIPEATRQRLRTHNATAIGELIWSQDNVEKPLFSWLTTPEQQGVADEWREVSVGMPAANGAGELVLRVTAQPDVDCRALFIWAMPTLLEQDSSELRAAATNVTTLERDLQQARTDLSAAQSELAEVRAERDAKSQRVGELRMEMLELEKELNEIKPAAAAFERMKAEQEAGLSGKLKGMFKK